MRDPGALGFLYLLYVLGFLPWVVLRSKRLIEPAGEGPAALPVSRTYAYGSTLASLLILFLFSWYVGRSWGFRPFAAAALGAREVLAGAAVLAVQFPLAWVARMLHSPEERRKMTLYRLIPRSRREWLLFVAMAGFAGVAEEAAYRGVLFEMLTYSLGEPWAAAGISALGFAVAHSLQGWRSAAVIFVIGLLMQALVWYTGTLVVAMAVHALYDVAAGCIGAWRIRTGQVDG